MLSLAFATRGWCHHRLRDAFVFKGRVHAPTASTLSDESCFQDDDDDDGPGAPVSVVALAQAASVGVETAHDEISAILSEWQEGEALADESGALPTAAEQGKMLERWRTMIERREAELRSERRREVIENKLSSGSWVPAYLTSFSEVAELEDDDGTFIDDADSANGDGDSDNGDGDGDNKWVYEWQKHAERARERSAADVGPRPEPMPFVATLMRKRNNEFRGRAKEADGSAIGIDLGTTNSAVAAVSGGKPYLIP